VRIVKNETLKTNIDLFVVLVLPLNEVKKTVTVKDTELADEFLAKIFTKYYQKKGIILLMIDLKRYLNFSP